MQRRQSTKSKSDLHRRKSTASVRSVPLEHIDPTVAQRDAKVAASQAFARGKDRLSAEMPLFPPPSPSSFPQRRPAGGPRSLARSDDAVRQSGETDGHGNRRQQSVRFVGASAASGGSSRIGVGKAVGTRTGNRVEDMQPPSIPLRSGSFRAARLGTLRGSSSVRSLSHASSSRRESSDEPVDTITKSYLNALAAEDEYFTPVDDIASAPSSYRRIRKSRSVLTLVRTEVHGSEAGGIASLEHAEGWAGLSQLSRWSRESQRGGSNKENYQPWSATPEPLLRAPKSMSFLRGHRSRTVSTLSRDSEAPDRQPESVYDGAGNVPQQTLRPKSSLFFGSRNKRTETGMRKSLRSSSSQSAVPAASSKSTLSLVSQNAIKAKARKVSGSFKMKLKKLFGFSKSENDNDVLPYQHIQAHKTHGPGFGVSAGFTLDGADTTSSKDKASVARVYSQLPSLHVVGPDETLRSRQGSLESINTVRKVSDEKSRVTSWASSGLSTVASQQQQAWGEWEKQRLSVIKENSAHAPSPSPRRPVVDKPSFESQLTPDQGATISSLQPGHGVDSQRIYWALMKRSDETRQLASIVENQRQSSGELSDPFRIMSAASSSLRTSQEGGAEEKTPMTIRCVDSQDENPWVDRCHPSIMQRGANLTRACGQSSLLGEICEQHRSSSTATASSFQPGQDKISISGRDFSPEATILQKANYATPSRTLKSHTSAFFGSPMCHTFRTESPYRGALQESMRATDNLIKPQEEESRDSRLFCVGSPPRQTRNGSSVSSDGIAYTESVYSDEVRDLASEQNITSVGIGPFEPAAPTGRRPVYQPMDHRVESSTGSQDWRMWLGADIANLERPPSASKVSPAQTLSEVTSAVPTKPNSYGYGHFQECTQRGSDEDESQDPLAVPTHKPTPPALPLTTLEPNDVRSPSIQASIHRTSAPSSPLRPGNAAPVSSSTRAPKPPPPPPIPSRSARRPSPSGGLAEAQSMQDLKASRKAQQDRLQRSPLFVEARRTKSLARIHSISRTRADETGSPNASTATKSVTLVKRTGPMFGGGTSAATSATSSPGLTAAVRRQFGGVDAGYGTPEYDKENHDVADKSHDVCGPQGLENPGAKAQTMENKQMVDLFLRSRRRRMMSSEDNGAFL